MTTTKPIQDLVTTLAIDLTVIPIAQLADYAAIFYFLTVEAAEIQGAIATETRPFLETFYHLVQLEDWQRAMQLLLWVPDGKLGEEFHHALGIWGQFSAQVDVYESLLHKVNRQCDMTCLNGLANYDDHRGDYAQAIALQRQHLALAEQEQDYTSQWLAWVGIGNAQESLVQYEQAVSSFEQALTIATATENVQGQAVAFGSLAKLYQLLGQATQAEAAADQSLAFSQRFGQPNLEITSLLILGKAIATQRDSSRYPAVEGYYQRALQLAERLNNHPAIAEVCWYLGDLYGEMDRDNLGLEILERGLGVARQVGANAAEGNILRGIGNLYCKNGHLDGGEYYFSQWLQLATSTGDRPAQRLALEGLAAIADQRGELQQAIALEEKRLDICRELNDGVAIAAATAYLGYGYMELGERSRALDYLLEALKWQQQINDLDGIQITLLNLNVLQEKLVSEKKKWLSS